VDGVSRRVFGAFTFLIETGAVERLTLLHRVEEVLGSVIFSFRLSWRNLFVVFLYISQTDIFTTPQLSHYPFPLYPLKCITD
jgi:hypothetical protein